MTNAQDGDHKRSAALPVDPARDVIFLSKGTPEDDQFVLWLAPRLEAAGYRIFADILTLEPGDRWRKEITDTLQNNSAKMLLCCSDVTLAKPGVQEEIAIAEDLARDLKDDRFIIPLRVSPYKKLFGIAGKQYVDFYQRWALGLQDLLDTLEAQRVPRAGKITINPNWELYRKRLATRIEDAPESLTTNWLPVLSIPNSLNYYEATGAVDHSVMKTICEECPFPAVYQLRGVLTFATLSEIENHFGRAGKLQLRACYEPLQFAQLGGEDPKIASRDASNFLSILLREAREQFCREKGLSEYDYSTQLAFYVDIKQVALGKKIPWGPPKERRSSMLYNIAQGKAWHYGVSANPQFWPFPHFRLKSRVIFSESTSTVADHILTDVATQHRLRRTVCKGWRNRRWHGQLKAFLQLISGNERELKLPLSPTVAMRLASNAMTVMSPVTTSQTSELLGNEEETDRSTLGTAEAED